MPADVAEMNTKALTSAALAGFLRPLLSDSVNMVSAPNVAKERGISVEETTRGEEGAYQTYMRFTVVTERQTRSVAGTVFSDGKPRIIQVKGINMEAELTSEMLYVTNQDKPGFIGRFGQLLGDSDVNIATFNLGRAAGGRRHLPHRDRRHGDGRASRKGSRAADGRGRTHRLTF